MASASHDYYRLTAVADALGLSPNTLRDWLQRGVVEFGRAETKSYTTPGQARLCNIFGVLRLLVVAKLNAYGVNFAKAAEAANAVTGQARRIWGDANERLSTSALLSHMTQWVLVIEAKPDGHSIKFANDPEGQVTTPMNHFALVRLGPSAVQAFDNLLANKGQGPKAQ